MDIFISRGCTFDRECRLRAETARMKGENGTIDVPIATVEDINISKLEWYRLTDETSERQWEDVN